MDRFSVLIKTILYLSMQAFLKERFMSLQLDGVRCLCLRNVILTDDLIPAMITALGEMSNLSCLFIKSNPGLCYDESNVSTSFCCNSPVF